MSLQPKKARMDYGEQLIPPLEYELNRAVGTTYSLDLEALMVLPVALFYSRTFDGDPEEIRFELLDAITKVAGKIDVFCQKGHISVPKKYHHLMAYWENGVHEVLPESFIQSFHPKIWVIRYEALKEAPKKPAYYRVLVTSRNLTQSRDWDLAISIEGEVSDEELPVNKPLVHFLQYLNSLGKTKIPEAFIRDVGRTSFDCPEMFDRLTFLPSGFTWPNKEHPYGNPITKIKWEHLLIVSPFLDDATLEILRKNTERNCHLLSRKEELDSVPEDILKGFNCWQFSNLVERGEYSDNLSENEVEARLQSLHAKFFVGMKDGRTTWYLGSANCSEPAQGRNVEFMVQLRGIDAPGIRIKDILASLTLNEEGKEQGLFERYKAEDREEVESSRNVAHQVRAIRHALASMEISGTAEKMLGGTAYALTLEIDARNLVFPIDFEVKIKPVGEQQRALIAIRPQNVNFITDFMGYEETSLSPFLEFSILHSGEECAHFLRSMNIVLPDSRLDRIFTSIIDSRDKFLKYLAFLLTGEEGGAVIEGNADRLAPRTPGINTPIMNVSVFERLLVAASRHSYRLITIEKLIERLQGESADVKETIISPEFMELWEVFRSYQNETGLYT